MSLQVGQVLNTRYRIVRLLGQGGFGAVYRAWDINLNRPCALKENMDTSSEAQRQFTREATILANLSHPNLPRVTDHFILSAQGQYLVMDFVEGEDLASLVRRQGALPASQAVAWISQVADALSYLHSRQPVVVHRDVKPANIRLTPDGRAMLVDFGLVKLFNPSLRTTLGARAVTPGYAPPEQYGQGNTDARTDLYALGATLYNLLTGREPMESVQRMAGGRMPAAHVANPQVPASVGAAVDQAMRLEPNQRFTSVAEFKAALTAPQEAFLVRPSADAYILPAAGTPLAGPPPERIPATQVISAPPLAGRPAQAGHQAQVLRPLQGAAPAPSYQPASAPARRSGIWIGLVVFLVLCLAGAVAAGALLARGQQRSAQQTRDASASQTAAGETRQAATVQVQATQTAVQAAQVESTRQARSAFVTAAESAKILVFGPASGELQHNADDTLIEAYDASVSLRNFIVEAHFFNPYDPTVGGWDYGFIFRHAGDNDEFRFLLNSNRVWELMNNTGSPDGEIIATGELPELDVSQSGEHIIRLIIQGNQGAFFLDGNHLADLDLTARSTAGDIVVTTGMYQGHEVNGYATRFTDFTVWSIP